MSEAEILNDKKLALYGKREENSKGAPKLQVGIYRGLPNISVFVNSNDDDGKPIRVGMDLVIWSTLKQLVHKLIESEPGTVFQILNRKGPPGKTFVESYTFVGRNKDGVMYIAIKKEGKKTVPFYFAPGTYWDLVDGQGNPITDAQKSEMVAAGWIHAIDRQVQRASAETYEVPQNPNQGGGRSGGGGKPSGGYSGGGGSADFDDDLPM